MHEKNHKDRRSSPYYNNGFQEQGRNQSLIEIDKKVDRKKVENS